MLSREKSDKALPTFISLLVVGVLLMTFDIRLEGGGVVGVLRSGTQEMMAPLEKGAALVVNPVADMIDSLANIASLREENAALEAQLAEARAQLAASQDQAARVALLEDLYGLKLDEQELASTVANVIGSPDNVVRIIDKGKANGVVLGQPVIDTSGYVVGTVKSVTRGTATLVPITANRQGLSVLVGSQVGRLTSQTGTSEMRLEIDEAREPVLEGDEVRTSSNSSEFPAGLLVGRIVADAAPQGTSLVASVDPFLNLDTLRIVVVLAWPPDPITAVSQEVTSEEETTSTTVPAEETSTTTDGGGG